MHTRLEQWAADCAVPGEQSWTSCQSRDSNPQPWVTSGFKSNALSIRPRLPVKSSVKFPQSVMIWAAMSSAGVGPLCFLKSTVNAAIYQEMLEHCILPSADKFYGDADLIFQQDLAPAHTAKGTKSGSMTIDLGQ